MTNPFTPFKTFTVKICHQLIKSMASIGIYIAFTTVKRYVMTIKTHYEKAEMEIKAIDFVRNELKLAIIEGLPQKDVAEIHARLMSLYAALDVHNIECIIGKIRFKKVA
jgi:hypothetical protein